MVQLAGDLEIGYQYAVKPCNETKDKEEQTNSSNGYPVCL